MRCSNPDNKITVTKPTDTTGSKTPMRDTVVYLTENYMDLFIIQSKEIKINRKANKPFNKLDYNKVIAYNYDSKGEGIIYIITDCKLAPTVKQQKELTQEQVDSLTNYLGQSSTYGGNRAFCFLPHLGIVFYKDRKIVEHISICLECNYLRSLTTIPATEAKKFKMDDGFEYPAEGFSKIGRQKINSLCMQLGFSNCADTLNAMFDE